MKGSDATGICLKTIIFFLYFLNIGPLEPNPVQGLTTLKFNNENPNKGNLLNDGSKMIKILEANYRHQRPPISTKCNFPVGTIQEAMAGSTSGPNFK